jgi:hypothetical protein
LSGSEILSFVANLWRWGWNGVQSFRGRGSLSLSVDGYSPVHWLPSAHPTDEERVIRVTVTAPKREEYVVAGGRIEGRVGRWRRRSWIELSPLEPVTLTGLPKVVPANRTKDVLVPGGVIADLLEDRIDASGDAEVRVHVHDHHGVTLVSQPHPVTVQDLRDSGTR